MRIAPVGGLTAAHTIVALRLLVLQSGADRGLARQLIIAERYGPRPPGHRHGSGRVLNTSAAGRILVGTSGWQYPSWRDDFYPRGLPQGRQLAYLASRLPTVEVNGTFYSLTRPAACDAWRAQVPAEFVFAIKGSRYITHMLKLRQFESALANFFASGILRLGPTLGPILWQLPPQLAFDRERARAFFAALPRDGAGAERWARRHDARTTGRAALTVRGAAREPLRHAVEVRHRSWLGGEALALLRAFDVALVAADTAGRHPLSTERTATFAYVRLHGATELYASRYGPSELRPWADRIAAWARGGSDVFVYFDNDARGHAPHDAVRLGRMLAEASGRPGPLADDGYPKSDGVRRLAEGQADAGLAAVRSPVLSRKEIVMAPRSDRSPRTNSEPAHTREDTEREEKWKMSPSTEVTGDRGENARLARGRRREENTPRKRARQQRG